MNNIRPYRKSNTEILKKLLAVVLAAVLCVTLLSAAGVNGNVAYADDAAFENMIKDFPEDYKPGLRAIHAVYPNYIFKADFISETFDTVVENEIGENKAHGKKVHKTEGTSWKAMIWDSRSDNNYDLTVPYDVNNPPFIYREGSWTFASREVVAYYLDPRNFLNTNDIYMFAYQGNSSAYTEAVVRNKIVSGTFLAGTYTPNPNDPDDVRLGGDYVKVIMEAAAKSNVSPYVLASTIVQEQGSSGSTLCLGNYTGADGKYKGYYNFFNFGATSSTGNHDDVVVNGLQYAMDQGWNSVYKSIVGGAVKYGEGYIAKGQSTYYYKDFNVKNGVYWHEYAGAIYDAHVSGFNLYRAFLGRVSNLTFKIPVYNNMPASPAPAPANTNTRNNYYATSITGNLSPKFDMYVNNYSMSLSGSTNVNVSVPAGASYVGPEIFNLNAGTTTIELPVRSESGFTRSYWITVTAPYACFLTINQESKNVEMIGQFVERLYQTCLGRSSDQNGLNDWVNQLALGTKSAF
ncbi:MAG: DUF4214 domain-containing protein [Parasporobacterium sp.]|nr:DUF4214 domain-containing protein [Parasporobacterium sp.]